MSHPCAYIVLYFYFTQYLQLVVTDLRRSTRKRRAVNMEDYETDSSRTDGIIDLIVRFLLVLDY